MKKFIALMLLIALAVPCCYASTNRVSVVQFIEKFTEGRWVFGKSNGVEIEDIPEIFGSMEGSSYVVSYDTYYTVGIAGMFASISKSDLSVLSVLVPDNLDFYIVFSILEGNFDSGEFILPSKVLTNMVFSNVTAKNNPEKEVLFYTGNYAYYSYYISDLGGYIMISCIN